MVILLSLFFLAILLNVVVRRRDVPLRSSSYLSNRCRYERATFAGQMLEYDRNTEFEPECVGELPSGTKLWEIRSR